MTLTEARQHLAAIPVNPRAEFIHQDFVEEAQRLRTAKDKAGYAHLEEALARVMLEGAETERLGAADALMAMELRASVLQTIAAELPGLVPARRDAPMRVLAVHRTRLSSTVRDDLDRLFLAHPREFLRLALAVLPDAEDPRLPPLWQALLSVASHSTDADELVLVARAAAASNRLDELLATWKHQPTALMQEVARLSTLGERVLRPLGIEGQEQTLARSIAACTDGAELAELVKTAVAVGAVNALPRWLKAKDRTLLQAASAVAGPDERRWLEAILSLAPKA